MLVDSHLLREQKLSSCLCNVLRKSHLSDMALDLLLRALEQKKVENPGKLHESRC